jgi:hypothetical protein
MKWALRNSWPGFLIGALLGVGIAIAAIRQDPAEYDDFWSAAGMCAGAAVFAGVGLAVLVLPAIALRPTVATEVPTPGAGVWRSLRKALVLPLIVSIRLLALALSLDRTLERQWYMLVLGLTLSWAFLRGGLFCLQHLVVRAVLTLRGSISWRYCGFLDFAARLLVLRKVGGGYLFVHRMVLEYFASLA